MPAATYHLTSTDYEGVNNAIEQGATYDRLAFFYPENVSSWSAVGQIRTNYATKDGVKIADFLFEPMQYAEFAIDGKPPKFYTRIKPYLTAALTQSLPWNLTPRKTSKEFVKPGRNVWVYDIELHSNDLRVIRLVEGYVEVRLEVTR